MLDEFLHTLEEGPRLWAYLLVAASSGVEYVFPPIPGDTVALFAVALAVRAQLHWLAVYLSMTVGALVGGLGAWGFGVWLANHEDQWPRFLKTPTATRALDAVRRGYAQHGAMYLAANRFLPALRAFFFVGAGLSKMPAGPVILYGGISALLWNAILMGVGYLVGNNWDTLFDLAERYTVATLILIVLATLAILGRFLYNARRP